MIGELKPLIFDEKAEIYTRHRMTFNNLIHLESIGLAQFSGVASFSSTGFPKRFTVTYYGRSLVLEMPQNADNKLLVGKVLLTRIGKELAPICGSKPVEGLWEYVKDQWKQYLPKAETE